MIPVWSGIYVIRNKVTNKVYVGSSKSIPARWLGHLSSLRKNSHHSSLLQNDWNKYGEDSFQIEVLEYVEDHSLLLSKEVEYIKELDALNPAKGYNKVGIKKTDQKGNENSSQSTVNTSFEISESLYNKAQSIANSEGWKEETLWCIFWEKGFGKYVSERNEEILNIN